MLTRTRETQIQRARRTTRDIVEYAREVARDERLRADVSAALAHGSKASDQLKKDLQVGGTAHPTLATDKKLRKNLRAMLDDLDAASSRLRLRKRDVAAVALVLMLAGAVAAALAFPRIRPWLEEQASDILGTGSAEPEPLT